MSNKKRTVLYTGVTNDLVRRRVEHREEGDSGGFCGKYNVVDVIYVEHFRYINDAIKREKRVKHFTRQQKWDLIKHTNSALASLQPPY